MAELPLNATIYGFAFTDDLPSTDMGEIRYFLEEKLKTVDIDMDEVVFSVADDKKSVCTWIVAADRYLNEDEVMNTVDFIIENKIEDVYLLMNFR